MTSIAIAVIVSLCAHIFIRRVPVACVVTALVSPVLYAIESFIRLRLPPAKLFWLPIIFLEVGLPALAISLVTGLPFYLIRRWRKFNVARNAGGDS